MAGGLHALRPRRRSGRTKPLEKLRFRQVRSLVLALAKPPLEIPKSLLAVRPFVARPSFDALQVDKQMMWLDLGTKRAAGYDYLTRHPAEILSFFDKHL